MLDCRSDNIELTTPTIGVRYCFVTILIAETYFAVQQYNSHLVFHEISWDETNTTWKELVNIYL